MTERTGGFRPIAALGAVTALWLIISAIGDGLLILVNVADIIFIQQQDQLSDEMLSFWQLLPMAGWPFFALFVVMVVMISMWIYRAAKNARSIRPQMETSPGWAVGWYFIPVANLWKPYQAMAEIWRISCAPDRWRTAETPAAMKGWWGAWVASNIISNVSNRLANTATTDQAFIVSDVVMIIVSLISIAAALCLRRIILQVTDAQTNRRQADVF